MSYPVLDMHCDLLSYLQEVPNADPEKREGVGCNFPALEEGNVKLQVMAIYTATDKGSTKLALQQSLIFKNLLSKYSTRIFSTVNHASLNTIESGSKLNILAAIENASGFCEEDETLQQGFQNLENIITNTGKVLYIGLTHHGENRFGGGNSTQVGLKKDGYHLLDYLHEKKIALDFSHTSDALATDILEHISKHNLAIPVLASHSNFRKVFNHPRNLPDAIAKEIIKRDGLIGMNFLRAFLNDKNPNALFEHIQYGVEMGAENAICFGADFFYTESHPDKSRVPFFYPGQDDSSCYPTLLAKIERSHSAPFTAAISHKNALRFLRQIL